MKILGVIPARFSSSRFPGKPLALIQGVPMLERVYTRAIQCQELNDLIIATDDLRIAKFCKEKSLPFLMTKESHKSGTDRLCEVAKKLDFDLYINIQGDEPVIEPLGINEVIKESRTYNEKYIAYNLYKNISENEAAQESIIKVVVNEKDELLYMSRRLIPFSKSGCNPIYKKQVCIYGFHKEALEIFSRDSKTLNEKYEDIEILRFLDLGFKVKMKQTHIDSISVDLPNDIAKVEKFLAENMGGGGKRKAKCYFNLLPIHSPAYSPALGKGA